VSLRLAEAEGRKGAAARGEGLSTVVSIELLNEASSRPSGNALPRPFKRRTAARQAGSGLWYAPVGAFETLRLIVYAAIWYNSRR